ncbi:NAD-dependent succinate-semialdehyde dehydrogenase [Dasania sp. GY-MA-18]|uniref:NAD-dependent succinate-semialdehyde dehydrogenase n=1 Tax=Dasania phycosphaerae TaxID=2950436 RepID=A0A9J6RMG8_9GAMM|nr:MULTISPECIES: NAD-dependent succinate-semialdehyde dehydrogenase [Dasania]MCR8922953.1 NAD-dependent succinate-semialdehyde dehydrogenase [Dasania sp. GY-MA-18]MCZ0865384.1 NAD-dependent succinate-semialdehyde dehydrogenase [Dasania phycosphaerae]MCZ0869109.1 NAD-dependent succinate-semialdehyde dehydrogenase [Dasania phycosphaerae]
MPLTLKDSSLLKGQAYINGQWIDADSGATLVVDNPANGAVIGEVARCGTAETKRAIDAAEAARPAWAAKSAKERAQLMRNLYNLMMENQEDLAKILTAEQGKPLAEARAEIAYSASFLEWFAEEGKRLYGDVIPSTSPDKRFVVIKQGIGVVACITPWNFPSAMLTRKIAPALAAGCTTVCKPANSTPYSSFAIAVLAERAGIPAGVINIIAGVTNEIGDELTSNPIVQKVTFTGSTPVGKHLMEQCAKTVKRTSMELGGNAPFIVFDDADLDAAVAGAMASKYRNSGQTCVCANRILVQEGVYDAFAEKFAAEVAKLNVGDGSQADTNMGPLITEKAANEAEKFVEDAVSKGATLYAGGRHELGGAFYKPTVLTNVSADMRVAQEEIFGPIAPLIKFSTEQEAIDIANDTEYGLASYFYSRDIGRVWRVSAALECGIVGINEGIISTEVAPFGGVKESGNGREGSKYGLEDYTEIKYLCMGGLDK